MNEIADLENTRTKLEIGNWKLETGKSNRMMK
jgi:hypothetical protein